MVDLLQPSNFKRLIDRSFHENYSAERSILHDQIILDLLGCEQPTTPASSRSQWLVFTAGPMGAGKSTILQISLKQKLLPLDDVILIDIDDIRMKLLKNDGLSDFLDPFSKGRCTQKESGYIAELAVLSSLSAHRHGTHTYQ
jgi:adenylylsulfate kinase-like enzyme